MQTESASEFVVQESTVSGGWSDIRCCGVSRKEADEWKLWFEEITKNTPRPKFYRIVKRVTSDIEVG